MGRGKGEGGRGEGEGGSDVYYDFMHGYGYGLGTLLFLSRISTLLAFLGRRGVGWGLWGGM